jgi:hypothetical protein
VTRIFLQGLGAAAFGGGLPLSEMINEAKDVKGDCEVDFEDFRLMALHWLETR